MTVLTGVIRSAANTSTGNQTFTDSGFGGETPKAAIFTVTRATVDGTATADAAWSFGFCDDTNEGCLSNQSVDNQATTIAGHGIYNNRCINVYATTGSVDIDGTAVFSSFSNNAVTVNWTDAPSAAYLVTVVLIGGSDVSAHCNFKDLANTVQTVDITDPGFQPDLVIGMVVDGRNVNATIGEQDSSVGFATSSACYCHNQFLGNGRGTSLESCRGDDDAIVTAINSPATLDWKGVCTAFDSSGFSVDVQTAGANNSDIVYLALAFGGAASAWVGEVEAPSSTGDQAYTGPSFTPQLVMISQTMLEAWDTSYTSGDIPNAWGVSVFTDSAEFSNSFCAEDGQSTSDTQNISDDTAINQPDDAGGAKDQVTASYVSMDANGWTLNYSSASTNAKKMFGLAIESTAAAGFVPYPNPRYAMAGGHQNMGGGIAC